MPESTGNEAKKQKEREKKLENIPPRISISRSPPVTSSPRSSKSEKLRVSTSATRDDDMAEKTFLQSEREGPQEHHLVEQHIDFVEERGAFHNQRKCDSQGESDIDIDIFVENSDELLYVLDNEEHLHFLEDETEGVKKKGTSVKMEGDTHFVKGVLSVGVSQSIRAELTSVRFMEDEKECKRKKKSEKKRKTEPLMGDIDPKLVPSYSSFPRLRPGQPSSTSDGTMLVRETSTTGELYKYRYSGSSKYVYLPEVRQHVDFENSDEVFNNYPKPVMAIMVLATLILVLSLVGSVVLDALHRVFLDLDGDLVQLKHDCRHCLEYMRYKGYNVNANENQTTTTSTATMTIRHQFSVVFVAFLVAISSMVLMRYFFRPILSRLQPKTAVAITIIWYLIMMLGELTFLNLVVGWDTFPQKVGLNLAWLCIDGGYCGYLTRKLAAGKLKLKQSKPVFYFTSTINLLLFLFVFGNCLAWNKITSKEN